MRLTLQENQALPGRHAPRYRQENRNMKTKILDEFTAAAGYNRKYAPRPLAHWGKEASLTADGKPVKLKAGAAKRRKGGGRRPVYGPDALASLRIIRAFFRYRRGKLLAPLLREQTPFSGTGPPSASRRRPGPGSCGQAPPPSTGFHGRTRKSRPPRA
jgi:hypothetical protein